MSEVRAVFVVDDDKSVREALTTLFEAAGYSVRAFASAEEFLSTSPTEQAGCLVLDVRLPGMSGLDLQRLLVESGSPIAVVIMTGHGDIPMAVSAVKEGAIDFVEKPFNASGLLESVQQAFDQTIRLVRDHAELAGLRERYQSLTRREQEVMEYLIEGKAAKEIARELGISHRTCETHRARVMEKMGAKRLSTLVKHGLALQRRLQ